MERKKLSLSELDAIPYYNEKGEQLQSKYIEREEQIDAEVFIPAHAIVLELGGRYGLAAAVINNRLDNPLNHIVVEPDSTVIQALKANRDSHLSYYTIFEGVISRTPMYFNQYGFSSFCSSLPNDTPIKTLTLEEVQETYSIRKFTHLVADCEGGLLDLFEENEDFVKSLEGIYFEQDMKHTLPINYSPLKEKLTAWNFVQQKDGFRQYWTRDSCFPK